MGIKEISEQYGPLFFRKRKYLSWRAPIVCKAIYETLRPSSVIDVGCAGGDLVKGFLDLGVDAYGIEGSTHAAKFFNFPIARAYLIDITVLFPYNIIRQGGKLDLALCIEVFNVLPPETHDTLINNLLSLSNTLLIGCGEDKRFGLEEKLMAKGLERDGLSELLIRDRLEPWKRKQAIKAIYYGLMIWRI